MCIILLMLGSLLEVEIAIAKLKKYKSPGSDQILAELIQAGGKSCFTPLPSWGKSPWYPLERELDE
jgi:hypothetical protein